MKTIVTAPITHLCPHVDEVDHGEIVLTFDGAAPELHEVRRIIDMYHDQRVTHEVLTEEFARCFPEAQVLTRWTTAGLSVECSA